MIDLPELEIKLIDTDALIPYARNARTHDDQQVAEIAASIREFGWTNPVLIDGENGLIAGHGRLLAARKLGLKRVPSIELSHLTENQKRLYVLQDNKSALNAGWDLDLLRLEMDDFKDLGLDLSLTGFSEEEIEELFDLGEADEKNLGGLVDRFLLAPFSVLNAREGWWQERKRGWHRLGIASGDGREKNLTWSGSDSFAGKIMEKLGTTSLFDPVLCEVAYRWFSPAGGLVLDPFSGGSVRGVVAAKLGRRYFGIDLRLEQVEANIRQWKELSDKSVRLPALEEAEDFMPELTPVNRQREEAVAPEWVCGDSIEIDRLGKEADFIFSCPPYADLEVYSDKPNDLSNMKYSDFLATYREIIARSCSLLKPNRFACFVVGEIRDKAGCYRDFVGDTVQAFRDAGLDYYNEAILVTAVGSLPVRAGRAFAATRKLGHTHQNILIFVKGDPRLAADACGDPLIPDIVFPESDDVITCPACQYQWLRGSDI